MKEKSFLIAGLVTHLTSYGFLAYATYAAIAIPPAEEIMHPAFAAWVFSAIVALLCIPFYFFDAFIALKRNFSLFSVIKFPIALAIGPMAVNFAGSADDLHGIIWNVYFAVLLVIEIISLFREYE